MAQQTLDKSVLKDSNFKKIQANFTELYKKGSTLGGGDMLASTYDPIINANTAKVSNVDHPLVETAVPLGALFTDTVYDDTTIQSEVDLNTAKVTSKFIDGTDPLDAVYMDGNVGIDKLHPQSKLDINGGVKIADDTDVASVDKVGTIRHKVIGDTTVTEECRQTGVATYEWVQLSNTINSITDAEPIGSDQVLNIVSLTQAEYDAGVIALTISATTLYTITDA